LPSPKVSVIIATYNWSAVLRCAIESVLLQSFHDFELLVVGDACTDDSEAVVRSFRDPRIQWINLERNSGSQGVPNNHGISIARGEYIAYLGHDDIWYPTHLHSLVSKLEEQSADLAGAATILYGPPESGVRAVSGVLEGDTFHGDDFLVPSSILHTRSLVDRIGFWRDPLEISLPPDCDFQKRAFESGAKITTTGEVSVFKFNAAWRKRAYIIRSAAEQEEVLRKIKAGRDFRHGELIGVVRSMLEDRYVRIKSPAADAYTPGEIVRRNARIKGVTQASVQVLSSADHVVVFDLNDQADTFDWYSPETCESGPFRWSGPSRFSTLEFPICSRDPMSVRVYVLMHFQSDLATDVAVFVNGAPVEHAVEVRSDGRSILSFVASSGMNTSISLRVKKTVRPVDLGLNQDRRWLGLAVGSVEFRLLRV
jgi:Glycosyl transferase family 2